MTAHQPDEVWQRFLRDSERAIRHTAPREPSAEVRMAQPYLHEEPVGELWQPEERPTGPTWRELDGPARRRRVGRVLGAAAAIALALPAANPHRVRSHLPGDTTSQYSETAPAALPTDAGRPTGPDSRVPVRDR
ncbi:hypothetical protein [Streptomyces sp. NPDC051636]|uniref:hypothetical protein n=1 Tax=Streptomyces sp. NPDC051636 TaxID=3365663 RepID=UPI0037BDA675